jgi:hypothetical protein
MHKYLSPSAQSRASIHVGASNTKKLACKLHESELFSRPDTTVYGRDGAYRKAARTTNFVFETSRPPAAHSNASCGFQSQLGAETMTTTTPTGTPSATQNLGSTLADALRAILAEVTPGTRPYSGDSYLPGHLIDAARLALAEHDQQDTAAQQHAHNALSMAAWHCARGEAPQALSRLRRAKSHIMNSMGVA